MPLGRRLDTQEMPEGEHEPHQGKASRQRIDSGRSGGAVIFRAILRPEEDGRVLVGIAERPDARQEQRRAFRFREEGLAQCAPRAAGREIDGGVRQGERIGLRSARRRQLALENGARKRRKEWR